MLESKRTFLRLIVLVWCSSVVGLVQLHAIIVNSNNAITSILPQNNDLCKFFIGWSLNALWLIEANLSGLVIIDNSDSSFTILSVEF